MKVVIYSRAMGRNKRVRMINDATAAGARRHGIDVVFATDFDGEILGDVAVAYGWVHEPIFTAYKSAGAHYVYWDLGYWGRRISDGYHRCAIDDWDTVVNMLHGCPSDRFDKWGIDVALPVDLSRRKEVLIAGMSAKSAGTHGFKPGEWETCTQSYLSSFGAPIHVRKKPTSKEPAEPIEQALSRTRLVVSHHSNVAIDALIAGVPSYVEAGIGLLTTSSLDVDNPTFPSRGKQMQTLYDAAYTQYSITEMANGVAWNYIQEVMGYAD